MLINYLTNYCNEEYRAQCFDGNCGKCDAVCTHPSSCPGDCEMCLEQVHFPKKFDTPRLDYTCKNILNFYICKYYFKYASEIEYAFHSISGLPYMQQYKVLSLGCGASPDLAALENFMKRNEFSVPIHYMGIDVNPLWSETHLKIKDYYKNSPVAVQYIYSDVVEVFKEHFVDDTNILILQYLISHFYNTGKSIAVKEFYENLCENVIKRMKKKSIIIINDVNSNRRGRDLFLILSDIMNEHSIKHSYSCRYFEYNIQNDYQRYGIKYPSKDILTWPTNEFARYNPWTTCSSAQLIIELE